MAVNGERGAIEYFDAEVILDFITLVSGALFNDLGPEIGSKAVQEIGEKLDEASATSSLPRRARDNQCRLIREMLEDTFRYRADTS